MQLQKQIPFGNDSQNSNSKGNYNYNGKGNYRGPSLRSRRTKFWAGNGKSSSKCKEPMQGSLHYALRASVEMTGWVVWGWCLVDEGAHGFAFF